MERASSRLLPWSGGCLLPNLPETLRLLFRVTPLSSHHFQKDFYPQFPVSERTNEP